MNPLSKGNGKGTGEKAGAFSPGIFNPGKGGGGPGKGFTPWLQRPGAPGAPRIGALGDDPSAWQIGHDGRVITVSPKQPPMPPQSWTSSNVSPPGGHPTGPLQLSPTIPATASWELLQVEAQELRSSEHWADTRGWRDSGSTVWGGWRHSRRQFRARSYLLTSLTTKSFRRRRNRECRTRGRQPGTGRLQWPQVRVISDSPRHVDKG